MDIDIEKPGCLATCVTSVNGCPPTGTNLRDIDICPIGDAPAQGALTSKPLSLVGWIILGKNY